MEFIYNNKKLQGRCIDFACKGSIKFKELFKENNMDCKVQVKKYIINESDDNYSPYHLYIEIKTPTGKLIVDNCDCYNYYDYKNRYRPRGISLVSQRYIKSISILETDIDDAIYSTILYHFKNIEKYYKPKN